MHDSSIMPRVVLSTVGSIDEGQRLARVLVEEQLAACVSLVPGVQSVYRWQGSVESATEVLLMIKTTQPRLEALEARIKSLHSYENPEFLVLDVGSGSHAFLNWIGQSVGNKS